MHCAEAFKSWPDSSVASERSALIFLKHALLLSDRCISHHPPAVPCQKKLVNWWGLEKKKGKLAGVKGIVNRDGKS